MKSTEQFSHRFRESLNLIPEHFRKRVNRAGGLSEEKLLDLIIDPQDYGVMLPDQPSEDVVKSTFDQKECEALGEEAIQRGEVAYCVLAGGAGTRIGEPKALLRLPGIEMSLLTLKLIQAKGNGPIWIIVNSNIKDRVADHVYSQSGIDRSRVKLIEQYESYRISPDNQIIIEDGAPDLYPCGHGDVFPVLINSGALEAFSLNGGKYVSIVNVDNVMASLDAAILGRHIKEKAKVTCEVVRRRQGDSGGVLCDVAGSLQIVESFRIHGVDAQSFNWLNTNSFVFDTDIDLKLLGNAWNRVQKNIGNKIVIQHERLLQEITAAYSTNYIEVERDERFMPIKNLEDLVLAAKKIDANNKSFP
mgnify:CR=1 FL=1